MSKVTVTAERLITTFDADGDKGPSAFAVAMGHIVRDADAAGIESGETHHYAIGIDGARYEVAFRYVG